MTSINAPLWPVVERHCLVGGLIGQGKSLHARDLLLHQALAEIRHLAPAPADAAMSAPNLGEAAQ